jgi:hypothetical protein
LDIAKTGLEDDRLHDVAKEQQAQNGKPLLLGQAIKLRPWLVPGFKITFLSKTITCLEALSVESRLFSSATSTICPSPYRRALVAVKPTSHSPVFNFLAAEVAPANFERA